jgi:hydrogenase expression/formation protein HypC
MALCAGSDEGSPKRQVNLALLEYPARIGDWLLVHVDVAVRTLAEREAGEISRALAAVDAAARGLPFEHLLDDLIEREPQLPAHLKTAQKDGYNA